MNWTIEPQWRGGKNAGSNTLSLFQPLTSSCKSVQPDSVQAVDPTFQVDQQLKNQKSKRAL